MAGLCEVPRRPPSRSRQRLVSVAIARIFDSPTPKPFFHDAWGKRARSGHIMTQLLFSFLIAQNTRLASAFAPLRRTL
jgi:hypothetical protein